MPLVSGPLVYTSLANDVSPPLSTLGSTQPTRQSSVGATGGGSILGPVESFEGISNDENPAGAQDGPPDANGAAGPHDYVQWVNDALAVYDKFGTRELGPMPGNRLWTGFGGLCESSNRGDPIVRYDQLAGRWILSQLAGPGSGENIAPPHMQCFAVSTSSDPLGTYYRYAFDIPGGFNDYVKVAVWPDAYYMTDDRYAVGGRQGSGAFAFDRAAMLAGRPATFVYFELDRPLFGILPSDLDGTVMPPRGTPDVFVRADDACGTGQDRLELWSLSVDWANPGAATFTQSALLDVESFDSTTCDQTLFLVPQPGGESLDLNTGRMLFRTSVREFGSYRSLVALHADVGADGRAGLRWYEIRYAGQPSTAAVHAQGTYFGPSGDSGNRWVGSAAQDRVHDIALGFSVDSAALPPSIGYAGRTQADPPNDLSTGEGRLVTGGGVQTDNDERWGDYSSLTVDPVDGCAFWYTTEYYPVTATDAWHTRIGSFRFPGCGALPTIAGVALEGRALTASPGTWSTLPGAAFAYKWRRCDALGGDCADISDATASTYTPTTEDVDGTIRVLVRATTATAEASALSEPTGVVQPTPAAGPLALTTSLAVTPSSATLGDQVAYTAEVGNSSPTGSATGVVFELNLPDGADLVSATADRGSGCTGTTDVICPLSFIPGGRTATVTVVARLEKRGQLAAVASVTADQAPVDPSAARSTATVSVTASPNLTATAPLGVSESNGAVTVSGTLSLDEPATVTVRARNSQGSAVTLLPGSALAGKTLSRSAATITSHPGAGTFRLAIRLPSGATRGRIVARATDVDGLTTVLSLPFGS